MAVYKPAAQTRESVQIRNIFLEFQPCLQVPGPLLSSCGVNVTIFISALLSQQKNTHFDVNIWDITLPCPQYTDFLLD